MTHKTKPTQKIKIISGGQTGADQAALDAAIHLGLPYGGWLPRGRKTEAGPLAKSYQLQELSSPHYRDRTRKNIQESDGTLILSLAPLSGGSALTEAFCIRYDRPCLHLNLSLLDTEEARRTVEKWLHEQQIAVLNVAGPRASGEADIYQTVYTLLTSMSWSF